MIYRLLFRPSPEPILISLLFVSSSRRSAQLLRVSRACHEEGSPVLYGQNQFALDWAYAGTEPGLLEFLQDVGTKNRQLIRHLSARYAYASTCTLGKIRERRSLRPVLENLDSLSLECCSNVKGCFAINLLRDVRRYLSTQRGPYQKLVRAFKTTSDHPIWVSMLSIRLISTAIRQKPTVGDHDARFWLFVLMKCFRIPN
jgi:hypothetical protein